jgi:protein involved in sex pheromone biosynthesis
MKNDLLERFIKNNPSSTKEEAEKVINEIMNKLKNYKKLEDIPKVMKVFFEYNEKYKL